MIKVWFDGGCGPRNPGGIASWGFIAKRDGEVLESRGGVHGFGEGMTNNLAEYAGLVNALTWLLNAGRAGDEITVYGDSLLVIEQMSGNMKASKSGRYYPLYLMALGLVKRFSRLTLDWIPREMNVEADWLASRARITSRASKLAAFRPGAVL